MNTISYYKITYGGKIYLFQENDHTNSPKNIRSRIENEILNQDINGKVEKISKIQFDSETSKNKVLLEDLSILFNLGE